MLFADERESVRWLTAEASTAPSVALAAGRSARSLGPRGCGVLVMSQTVIGRAMTIAADA